MTRRRILDLLHILLGGALYAGSALLMCWLLGLAAFR